MQNNVLFTDVLQSYDFSADIATLIDEGLRQEGKIICPKPHS